MPTNGLCSVLTGFHWWSVAVGDCGVHRPQAGRVDDHDVADRGRVRGAARDAAGRLGERSIHVLNCRHSSDGENGR